MFSLTEIVWIALLLVPLVWALSDIFRTSDAVWGRSGHSQVLWVVLVLFAPLLGPLLYFLFARPALRES